MAGLELAWLVAFTWSQPGESTGIQSRTAQPWGLEGVTDLHQGRPLRKEVITASDRPETRSRRRGWELLFFRALQELLCSSPFTWLGLSMPSGEAAFSSRLLALGTMHFKTPKASTYQFDRYIFIGVEIFACKERKTSFSCTIETTLRSAIGCRDLASQLPSQIQIHASNTVQISKPGQALPFIQHKVTVFYGSTSVWYI